MIQKKGCLLYESMISCIISGFDHWRWIGYFFVDTYHDRYHDDGEKVQNYYDDSLEEDGLRVDPFTRGERAADRPIQDPRLYFLTVLDIRVHQISQEWESIVHDVQCSVREYTKVCCVPLYRH